MKKTIFALFCAVLSSLSASAEAASFRARARENFSNGLVNFGDGRGNLHYAGLASAFNFWFEEKLRWGAGLTVHRGRLGSLGTDDSATQTALGLEGKYFPVKDLGFFLRGGLLAEAVDPAGPTKAAWVYGPTAALGWEFLVGKVGLAPEFGGRILHGGSGKRATGFYGALGVHFYVF